MGEQAPDGTAVEPVFPLWGRLHVRARGADREVVERDGFVFADVLPGSAGSAHVN